MKTNELTGAALDWAVAQAENALLGVHPEAFAIWHAKDKEFNYSSEWAQGGPIIERECIELAMFSDQWRAVMHLESGSIYEDGQTPLIAAMRCYVASKLGDTVDIPEGLQ